MTASIPSVAIDQLSTNNETPYPFSDQELENLNKSLENYSTEQILLWSIKNLNNLYQTTAFGLTGLVTIDLLSKIYSANSNIKPIDLIFLDTLHHFPQTLDLLKNVQNKYPFLKINIFKPHHCESELEFAKKYGDNLWENNDNYYDFLVKVEPLSRAYKSLNVNAILTGRRKVQGGGRSTLKIIELDRINNIIKINPLINWDFNQVKSYITDNNVPYNELLNYGYKSVGDYHSTFPVGENENERDGRWKGKSKSECGIHEFSRFAQYLKTENENERDGRWKGKSKSECGIHEFSRFAQYLKTV
ncbi:phosphoadenylyl-sulfate reductase (thioredoxin) [Ascoidea rubescens DSM 1968]|uniref:Phosphoadenosine phosphosulfate reductase n=1 Tax=Ascoidea rubescens DSM 1968 TaxID=1344418 RepID=A0A1D2VHB0_9ASCO|nr:Phosphoadenosine phosphosulfate reductase [Ascoidea rubescens DSM 1968]ODV60883.1 Phosphoadenosine phosphosulfate reductase [Ascoidea rubescens DSM 1968]